jgi:RHS repeat-associated protein
MFEICVGGLRSKSTVFCPDQFPRLPALSNARDYVLLGGEVAAVWENASLTSYVVSDAHGNTRLLLSGGQAVMWDSNYKPYGTAVYNVTATGNDFQFETNLNLGSTGLVYSHARWYVPTIGRFTSRDPIERLMGASQDLNAYTYAGVSPKTFADPTGLCKEQGNFLDTITAAFLFPLAAYQWWGHANDQQRGAMGWAIAAAFIAGIAIGLSCFLGCWAAPLAGPMLIAACGTIAGAAAAGIVYIQIMSHTSQGVDRQGLAVAVGLGGIVGGLVAGGVAPRAQGAWAARQAAASTRPVGSAQAVDAQSQKGVGVPSEGAADGPSPTNGPYGRTPAGRPYTKHFAIDTPARYPARYQPTGEEIDFVIDHPDWSASRIANRATDYYNQKLDIAVVTGRNGIVSARRGMPPEAGRFFS